MLNVQYRMHPAIARFPASEFYNNMLLDGMVDAAGGVPSRLNPPASTQLNAHADAESRPSVIFLDHGGNESAKDKSRVNWNEAHIVCSVIEDLLLNNEVRRHSFICHGAHSLSDSIRVAVASTSAARTSVSSPPTPRKFRSSPGC